MYTLFVSGEVGDEGQGVFTVRASRFLEYTSGALSAQLESLSIEAVSCIKSWPCILMQEGQDEKRAHLAQVTSVERVGADVRLTVAALAGGPAIHNSNLWALRHDLDIEDFEFYRHHLAVKECDLLSVLAAHGHNLKPDVTTRFSNKPLPVPTRAMLVRAIDIIGAWGHTAIDRFLLEAGVRGLSAGRDLGGRQNRAHAIAEFAIAHPSATTAENSLFSTFLLSRAFPPSAEPPDTPAPVREASIIHNPGRPTPPQLGSGPKPGADLLPRREKGLKLFYSYSHKDEGLREILETHLSLLKRQGVIKEWHDRKILAGSEWKDEIDNHLASADIVLLLVSADFMASDYCYDIEMQKALERHSAGESRVIPVLLRAVDWTAAPFGKLQALPKDAKPITSWQNLDEAFLSVAVGLRRVAEAFKSSSPVVNPSPPTQAEATVEAMHAPRNASSEYRFLVKEGEKVPFDRRVTGRGNFIYDFSIDIPFVAIEGIKAYVQVFQCSSDRIRKMVDEAEALVTSEQPLQIPRTPWQLCLVEARGATAVVELRKV